MPLAKRVIARWVPLCAGGLVACSGTAGSGLMSPPASVDAGSDASVASVYTAVDGSPETQASSATPGALSGGQGDGALIEAGDAGDALDAGTDAGPSSNAPFDGSASDAGTCVVTFTVTGALVDGFVFQTIVLGGDAAALGGWDSTQALKMTMTSTVGTWAIGVPLADGTTVHFKFGMSGTGGQFAWETDPQNVDRALVVSCPLEAGDSYIGQMNQIPDGGS
jgi:Starch binding domain